jgi:hypothetical protein
VKIAIKYQVKESWNPKPFMVELNRTARNVMAPQYIFLTQGCRVPETIFQVNTGEIPVF